MSNNTNFKIATVKGSTVQRRMRNRTSKYQEIIDAVLQLDEGKSVLITVPKAVEPGVFRNLLNNAIRGQIERAGLDRDYIRFYLTQDLGAVEIYMCTDEEVKARHSRSAKANKK